MAKLDDVIATLADDLLSRCGITPDLALLTRVAIGCGPAIHDPDQRFIDMTDRAELARLKSNFLIRKLGLPDGPALAEGIEAAIDAAGGTGAPRFRAVVHYLLVRHFGRESVFR